MIILNYDTKDYLLRIAKTKLRSRMQIANIAHTIYTKLNRDFESHVCCQSGSTARRGRDRPRWRDAFDSVLDNYYEEARQREK